MKRTWLSLSIVGLVLCGLNVVPALGQSPTSAQAPELGESPNVFPAMERGLEGQWIVVFHDSMVRGPHNGWTLLLPSVADVAAEISDRANAEFDSVLEHALRGVRVHVSEAVARRIAKDPRVRYVEQDRLLVSPELFRSAEVGQSPPALQPVEAQLAAPVQALDFFVSAPVAPEESVHVPYSITCDDPDPRNPNGNCVDNWGLDRVDQISQLRDGTYDWLTPGTAVVHVYAIDTGAYAAHPEFIGFNNQVRVTGGINASVDVGHPDRNDTSDCASNSHGTHVAGIVIGATYGVAKDEVLLHPVKYFDPCKPLGGNTTALVRALDWIVANHQDPAVVNFSGGNGDVFDDTPSAITALKSLVNSGILMVQSAGNQSTDACEHSFGSEDDPVLGTGVLVVGASDENQSEPTIDGRWISETGDPQHQSCVNDGECGSNYGTCLDLWAPGAHVISAANTVDPSADAQDGDRRLTGTSMAAPHVTGAVAQYLRRNPTATPAQIHQAILDGATCGELDDNLFSPYDIFNSPNILLEVNLQGNCP